jgi:hypothetical protein
MQQREFGPKRANVKRECAVEFAEGGGVATRFLRIAIAARRPAFRLGVNYPPPFTGEIVLF